MRDSVWKKKIKGKKMWIFNNRTEKWEKVSVHNPNYEWRNGEFVRKAYK